MFYIKTTIGGNTISATIHSPIVQLISSDSGTGKSLYADLLVRACNYERKVGLLVNYATLWHAEDIVSNSCENGIIIFDNIEQYLDRLSMWLPEVKGTALLIGRSDVPKMQDLPKACLRLTAYTASLREMGK